MLRKAGTVTSSKSGSFIQNSKRLSLGPHLFHGVFSFPTLTVKYKSFGAVHLAILENVWQQWLLKTMHWAAKRKILKLHLWRLGWENKCILNYSLSQYIWFLCFPYQGLSKVDCVSRGLKIWQLKILKLTAMISQSTLKGISHIITSLTFIWDTSLIKCCLAWFN